MHIQTPKAEASQALFKRTVTLGRHQQTPASQAKSHQLFLWIKLYQNTQPCLLRRSADPAPGQRSVCGPPNHSASLPGMRYCRLCKNYSAAVPTLEQILVHLQKISSRRHMPHSSILSLPGFTWKKHRDSFITGQPSTSAYSCNVSDRCGAFTASTQDTEWTYCEDRKLLTSQRLPSPRL